MMYQYEGAISVKSALESPYRSVSCVYMDEKKKSKDFGYILRLCEKDNVEVKRISKEVLDEMAQGQTHGGVLADVFERTYQTIEDVSFDKPVFLALLEGIEDPFNFGYCLRTLYAFGCDAVLVPVRNWTTEAGLIAKSSAGASDKLPIIVVEDWEETLTTLQNKGVQIYCAMREDAKDIYDVDYTSSCLLAIGGPLRGLSHTILSHTDQNVVIPYANDFRNALNGGSAISVISSEIYRQRRYKVIK